MSSPANAAAVASFCGRTTSAPPAAAMGRWSPSVVPAHLSLTASASARPGWPATMRAELDARVPGDADDADRRTGALSMA